MIKKRMPLVFRLFYPEFITSFLIYSLPMWLDANFISHLKSTPTYATLGVTNNFVHLLFKLAEACSIGMVILVGHYNGKNAYRQAGRVVEDTFWLTFILGAIISCVLFFGAGTIYWWLGVPAEISQLGIPFLRLRAIGVFFTFLYLAFIGFLRGIKNTRTPMYVFILGAMTFVFLDYCLIFGSFGCPALGLKGSAIASVMQAVVMSLTAAAFVFGDSRYRKYGIKLFSHLKNPSYIGEFLSLVWPITLDKVTLAWAYIWLNKMIAPLGTCPVATFCVVKDMERFAFLPAIACAQVITIIVSNDYGTRNWDKILSAVKKVVIMASVMVGTLLISFSLFTQQVASFFDKNGDFTQLTLRVFPILSVLVFFDLLQLILSGALRGANNVKIVMFTRLGVCFLYFVPVSWALSLIPMQDQGLKFLLIYASFYIGNALMAIVYIKRFAGERWKTKEL